MGQNFSVSLKKFWKFFFAWNLLKHKVKPKNSRNSTFFKNKDFPPIFEKHIFKSKIFTLVCCNFVSPREGKFKQKNNQLFQLAEERRKDRGFSLSDGWPVSPVSANCLRIPIGSNASGGELNANLGVLVAYWSSSWFATNFFVVSGSPSNPMLGEVAGMQCWGSFKWFLNHANVGWKNIISTWQEPAVAMWISMCLFRWKHTYGVAFRSWYACYKDIHVSEKKFRSK